MPKRIHIFKTGRHTPMQGNAITFSEGTVSAIAANYDPALSEAPVVVGHPKTDAPAFGWVKGVSFEDGNLFAEVDELDPSFAEAVSKGRYKKISAAFYLPNGPNNPTPGQYYLRHVGFLGAANPAVKGLQPVHFSDGGDDVVTIELSLSGRHQDGRADFSDVEFADVGGAPFRVLGRALRRLREYLIADKGMETADDVLPSHDVDVLNELAERADEPPPAPAAPSPGFSEPEPTTPQPHEDDMTDTRTAADQTTAAEKARQAELERREKEIAAKEAAFAEQAARNEAEAFVKPLVEQGKVLPGESDALIAFMAKVDAEETVEFADGASKPATAVFKDFLTGLPQRVDFSERTGKVPGETTDKQNATAIANAAHKLVKARADEGLSISFSDAVIEVTKDS